MKHLLKIATFVRTIAARYSAMTTKKKQSVNIAVIVVIVGLLLKFCA